MFKFSQVIYLSSLMKLQASIARGHPEDAVNNCKETLSNLFIKEEQLHATLEIPEEGFILRTVEQLIQSQG